MVKEEHELHLKNKKGKSHPLWLLVFQNISQIAPAGSMAALMTGTALFSLGMLPVAYLFALLLTVIMAYAPYQFSKRNNSSGAYYSYVSDSISKKMGVITGHLYILYQIFNIAFIPIFFTIFMKSTIYLFTSYTIPDYLIYLLLMVPYVITFVIAYSGIKISLAYSIYGGVIELAILIIAGILFITHPATTGNNIPYSINMTPLFFIAVVFASLSFAGYGSSLPIGESIKSTGNELSKSVIISILIAGLVFIFIAAALTIGWGLNNMKSFGTQIIPGIILSYRIAGPYFTFLLFMVVINSGILAQLAMTNALARVISDMSNKGALSPYLSIKDKNGTPVKSIRIVVICAIAISVTSLLLLGPLTAFVILAITASIANLLIHSITNTGLLFFYNKLKKKFFAVDHLFPITSTVFAVITIAVSMVVLYPYEIPPLLILGYISIIYYRYSRSQKNNKINNLITG
ncbi:MAG: APC family permease [Candidatus Thermoplasmatota archaeon]|jgi:amino acid transporter|nr:APC family permease [Candidatus Thermoplasmatota archaeon]MCL5963159.1 APC family permease [Candidatus Thermoplasmatota archaeon]